MKRLGLSGLAMLLAAISLTSSGCCKKEKQQITVLQAQYNELSNQNVSLKTELAQAKTREAELLSQVADKDVELSGKDQEIFHLEAGLKKTPVTVKTIASPEGWDVGRFADKLVVGSDILFAPGRATLTAKGRTRLDRIVGDLKGNYPGRLVRVYGYTDSDPIRRTKNLWKDNLDLSANRAMAVTRYLAKKGIDREKIETIAMGAAHFIANNTTRASKARNRRVEIVVIKR